MVQSFNSSLSQIAARYTTLLGIPVTYTTMRQKVEEDPYYPSMYSLSRVFDKFNIENGGYQVEPAHFEELKAPFIAFLRNQPNGKDFVLVTTINKEGITYQNGNGPVRVSKEQFLKEWQRVVFIASPTAQSGEPDYANRLRQERQQIFRRRWRIAAGLLVFILTALFSLSSAGNPVQVSILALLLIKTAGFGAAILLQVYEIDQQNSFVRNICSLGKQTNCQAVLQSKAASVFGISWSDLGLFYFAGTTLFLLFPGVPWNAKMPLLALTAAVVPLYIPFSIYYQWRVVKQWCLLCLAVQFILLAELIWSFTVWQYGLLPFSFTNNTGMLLILSGAICFLLPLTGWPVLKKLILQAREQFTYQAAYKRLLYNSEIFSHLLEQQEKAPDGYQQIGITIGNPQAAHTIIKVCNPYCGPCAKLHPVLDEIISQNTNINVRVVFTASNADNDPRTAPVKHLLAIAARGDARLTQQALDDWYGAPKKDYAAFAAQYPTNGELHAQHEQVAAMEHWCKEAEIAYTPTLFIDGRRLPKTYQVEELKYIF